jgi:hypothetical protein
MMTVVCRPKRMRRIVALAGNGVPPTWRWTSDGARYLGSAKPGRGGRRQRKRRAAGSRAAEAYCENVMTPNVALMNVSLDRANRKLPQAFGRHPLALGYRERRRRAKARRRRWRRDNAWCQEQRELMVCWHGMTLRLG